MSSDFSDFDTFLDAAPMGTGSVSGHIGVGSGNSPSASWFEPGYEGSIDYRIRQLSYSSLLTLHSCPRKYELYKKRATAAAESETSTITFAFGHIVGEAIQLALTPGISEDQIIWKMFLTWHADLFASDEKACKSFWDGVVALKRFMSLREAGLLADYELVYFQGKPACELSFCINFPDGFRYRGHVDAVLTHKISREVLVLECKTTKTKSLNPNTYKNSAQAIGYSIILDSIFPELSSYHVLYLVYQTISREFTQIPFRKTYLQRALWIRELLLDIEKIKMYEEAQIYPMHGESCVTYSVETEKESKVWIGDCEYINTCTLSNEHITMKCTAEMEDKTEYQVNLTLADLLNTQLEKVT